MVRSIKLLTGVLVLGAAIAIARPGAPPPQADPPQMAATATASCQPCLVGVGGCSASSCHGAAIGSPHAWQSSFTVWATQDPHAEAYSALFSPAAAQIVANLAGGDASASAAYQDSRCLGCHSLQSEGSHDYLADGVGCEGCHGAAGKWVGPHTMKGWQPAVGMVNTKDAAARARKCVECHVGAEPRVDGATRDVNHDLIAAGHPRLAFELYAYLSALPKHWETFPEDPLQAWALGKLVSLNSAIELTKYREHAALQSEKEGETQPWPEFAEYDCYSCHRPMQSGSNPQASSAIGVLRPSTWYSSLADLGSSVLSSEMKFESQAALRHASPLVAIQAQQQIHSLLNSNQEKQRPWVNSQYDLLVNQIIERTDTTNWDQVAQAYHALQAVAKSRYKENPSAELTKLLADLRTLLEFPLIRDLNNRTPLLTDFGKPAHYDGPRHFSPESAAKLLKKISDAI